MWKQRGDFCMKIAICDDEQPVLNQLHKFINKYALDNLFDYTPEKYYWSSAMTTGRTFSVGLSVDIDRIVNLF